MGLIWRDGRFANKVMAGRHLDLSRFRGAPGARLSHLPFEGGRAFPAQCRVAAAWIVEAVGVFEDRHLSLSPGFP